MPSASVEQTFTYTLTNDTLTISSSDNVQAISIQNISATNGTVVGGTNFKVNNKTSTSVAIEEDKTVTITATGEAGVLDGITVSAPAGCTLLVLAQL